jgi:hypothetical protein
MCAPITIRQCQLGYFTSVAAHRRNDGVRFYCLGIGAKDALEEMEHAFEMRNRIEVNLEAAIFDGENDDYFSILVPGHPNQHSDFAIEVIGQDPIEVDTLRHVLLTRVGLSLPESPARIESSGQMQIFHFDGSLVTLAPVVAGSFRHTPNEVRAAFGDDLD